MNHSIPERTIDDVFQELLRVTNAASSLLAALDRQYGGKGLSLNAAAARDRLRALIVPPPDERDRQIM